MARILCVGSAVLDLVFTVPRHPAEDEELRAEELRVSPGGNAANTARVLAQLGHQVTLAAVLADHPTAAPLEEGLRRAGVDLSACRRVPALPPLSAILLHRGDGSRTIVHHRATPEYSLEDLGPLDLARFHWAHFEARPGPDTVRLLRHVHLFRPDLPCSLEVEKVRPGIEEAFPCARAVFFSRDCARARGFPRPEPFLDAMGSAAPGTLLVVAWGSEGAWGREADGTPRRSSAYPPPRVVDTIGAGDTFHAGVIDALARGRGLAEALEQGCRLAGRKVGRAGLDGLAAP